MAATGRPRDDCKEDYWRTTLRRWQQSGLSIAAFCACHGLEANTFYRWRRILLHRDRAGSSVDPDVMARRSRRSPVTRPQPLFVPLRVQHEDSSANLPPVELLLANGLTLRVPANFDAVTLQRLLSLLQEPAC